jgi:hypothetical protein
VRCDCAALNICSADSVALACMLASTRPPAGHPARRVARTYLSDLRQLPPAPQDIVRRPEFAAIRSRVAAARRRRRVQALEEAVEAAAAAAAAEANGSWAQEDVRAGSSHRRPSAGCGERCSAGGAADACAGADGGGEPVAAAEAAPVGWRWSSGRGSAAWAQREAEVRVSAAHRPLQADGGAVLRCGVFVRGGLEAGECRHVLAGHAPAKRTAGYREVEGLGVRDPAAAAAAEAARASSAASLAAEYSDAAVLAGL